MQRGHLLRDVLVGAIASAALLLGSVTETLDVSLTEVFGFITGGASVWLVVKESAWTWPVGIANNVFFLVLFLDARLYADAVLQLVYIALSIGGLTYWLWGGEQRTRAQIRRAVAVDGIALAATTLVGTWLLALYLRSVDDSAPLLDALTTCLSLAATYLMAKKLIESWWVWIAADVIYVPLYVAKELPLTGVLYAIFLAMCVRGRIGWARTMRAGAGPAGAELAQAVP